MKKMVMGMVAAMTATMILGGCVKPEMRSMGATVMTSPLPHRSNGTDEEARFSVDGSGFVGYTSSEGSENVKNIKAWGGNVSVTYRLGGDFSPLFVNGALVAFGGSTEFDCTDDRCDMSNKGYGTYVAWLNTPSGKREYHFWNMQQRVLLGLDFTPGKYGIVGGGAGLLVYQGTGSYEDKRQDLEDEKIVDNVEDSFDAVPLGSLWGGSFIGKDAKYGKAVLEFSMLMKHDVPSSLKLTYTHPTGFYGGVALGTMISSSLYLGKEFVF